MTGARWVYQVGDVSLHQFQPDGCLKGSMEHLMQMVHCSGRQPFSEFGGIERLHTLRRQLGESDIAQWGDEMHTYILLIALQCSRTYGRNQGIKPCGEVLSDRLT